MIIYNHLMMEHRIHNFEEVPSKKNTRDSYTWKTMMPAFAFNMKYGDRVKVLAVVVCCFILLLQLTFITIWRSTKQESINETITSKHDRVKNVKIERVQILKPVNSSGNATQETEKKMDERFKMEDADIQIQQLLAPFVNDSLGRILNIEFKTVKPDGLNESRDVLDIVYRKTRHGVTVFEPRNEVFRPLSRRFVYVFERYWEQLTMNTRVLMALASQARIGGRFVVEPKVKDSTFGDTGYPFSTYYNIAQMNTVLQSNGYSTLVTQDEYEYECSFEDNVHAILHFLYEDEKAINFLKSKFDITRAQYDDISKAAQRTGWTSCETLKPFSIPISRVFCVDPTVVTDWDVLEQGILQDVKCLGIFVWRGLGVTTRTSFSENHVKVSSKEIHFLLKPSLPILNEAEVFIKTHLSGGYIGVHVRGEKVVLQHGLTRLKKCLRLLVNVVENTKSFGITKVFVASDMSSFGSGSWAGSMKDKKLDVYVLKTIQSSLISRIGAVVYKPSADWQTPDRGAVSLVELSIIAHAQHLLTIGTGSFQEWMIAKFLEFHRDDHQQWSLTRMCSLP